MHTDDVLDVFREAGALLEGHFILSSGRRSSVFLQKALIFKSPVLTSKLCKALATKVQTSLEVQPDIHMGLESIFVEREEGEFALRRGFSLKPGQKVLMVEDIVTTGLSSRECIASMNKTGAIVIAGACIFDRSNGGADIGVPLVSLAARKFPDYDLDDLPAELAKIPAIKPGSRGLK